MDFRGQALAEHVSLAGLIVAALTAFYFGWTHNDFDLLAKIYGAGVALVVLTVIPDHPYWPTSKLFNSHPVRWLPPLDPSAPIEKAPEPSLISTVLSWLGFGTTKKPSQTKSSRKKRS